jgi:hypothetical protein
LVYCRITLPNDVRPNAGEYRVVRGIPLAVGPISLTRGGFAYGVYLACSSWRLPKGPSAGGLRLAYLLGIDLRGLMKKHGERGIVQAWDRAVEDSLPLSVKRQLPRLVRLSYSREELEARVARLLETRR